MINNQLGRRNISNYDRTRLALKYEEIIKPKAKEQLKTHTKQGYQKSDKAIHTIKEVAKIAKVSQGTRMDLTPFRNLKKVNTQKEISKIAKVSHTTVDKVNTRKEIGKIANVFLVVGFFFFQY